MSEKNISDESDMVDIAVRYGPYYIGLAFGWCLRVVCLVALFVNFATWHDTGGARGDIGMAVAVAGLLLVNISMSLSRITRQCFPS